MRPRQVIKPDDVLDGNKGHFQQLAIVGYDQEGKITICATHGSREVLWMLERAKIEAVDPKSSAWGGEALVLRARSELALGDKAL